MADARLLPPGIADDRNQALIDLTDRLTSIDRSILFLYRFDSTPAAALYALAWQFAVTGLAGWDLASTEAERRDLLRRALEWHRHRGTPWVIREALAILGFPDSVIVEQPARPRRDGSHHRDGSITRSPGGAWAVFSVMVGTLADLDGLSEARRALIEGVINTWKNARSQLSELHFLIPPMSDAMPAAPADSAMTVSITVPRLRDGSKHRDGTWVRSGTTTSTMVAA